MAIVTGKKSTYTIHVFVHITKDTLLPKVPKTYQIEKHHHKVFFVDTFKKAVIKACFLLNHLLGEDLVKW